MGKKYKSKLKGSYKFNGRVIKSNHFSVSIEFTGGFARKLAINLNLSEERKSERLKKILSGELKRSFFEVIPFSGNFIFSELSEKHLGSGWYRDSKGKNFRLGIKYLTGTKIRHFKRPKNIFLRKSQILEWNLLEKLKKINSAYYKFLRHIIDNKIYFLRVSKINKVKPEKTYDIQVRGDHEFVANGLISHNCLGKYHPHGDVAVYEALVRLAQDFSLRYPLVFGQGNFGSVDGDAPAAQRYTETRLQPIAMELIEDIEKETVEFVPNYDNSLKEPKLFPGKLPSLIINGAVGIAVGMATSIPSHNLTEVCDAIIAKIKNPGITLKELLEILSGPDFPTGGSVTGDMEEIYKTGRGKFIIRGKVTTEKLEKKNAIVISEIPYMVNKSVLITQIAQLISNKKIKDVVDLRDESSKGKIRVVLELRKEANSKFAINALYKFTRLQDSFNMNFLALVDDEPKVLNLQNVLDNYIKYRKNIVQRRIKFELKKAKERLEIVVGLVIALKDIDSVIKLIKNSKTAGDAASSLTDKYKLTSRQAQAVLDTKLHQLTSLEINKLVEEEKLLNKNIGGYNKILSDINEVLKIIVEEVKEIKKKFGDERKTKVLDSIKNISEKDLIAKKDVVITITDKGYCKRMDVKTYKEQKRGGRGVIGSGLAAEDFVKQLIFCSTHDYLMFFTTRGRVLWLKAYDIPAAERYSKGKALVNLLNLRDENITKVISLKNFEDNLFMATKKGMVKKISLKYFSKPRASGIKAINLPADNSDLLIGVEVIKKDQEVLLATRKGQAIRFSSVDIRNMGRVSYGVTGIKLERNDAVVSLEVLDTDAIITITKKGYGKRTAVKDYRKTARAGKGVINLKVTEKTGEIITTVAVNDEDNIIITTAKGMVIRTSLKNIRIMGRATQGVRLVKLQHGDYVTDLVKVPYAREVFEEE